MINLVLLRHGESIWNKDNLFTGWADVDLSVQGKTEAARAGELLKAEGFSFDVAFSSVLKRAIRTLWITLDVLDSMWIPVQYFMAAQRAALWGTPGIEQSRDRGEVR